MIITIAILFFLLTFYILFSNQQSVMSVEDNSLDDASNKPSNDKIIVIYKGNEYDITDFIGKHPGGKKVLLKNNGNDIETLMIDNGHSLNAYIELEKYKINKQ